MTPNNQLNVYLYLTMILSTRLGVYMNLYIYNLLAISYDYMTCIIFLYNLKRQRKRERKKKEMMGQEKRDWKKKVG